MKRIAICLLLLACTHTPTKTTTTKPQVTSATKQIKNPGDLVRWYKYDVYQEPEMEPLEVKDVALELLLKGKFRAHVRYYSSDKKVYQTDTINGRWSFEENDIVVLKVKNSKCRYHAANVKDTDNNPVMPRAAGRSLTRKVVDGSESETEFCKYQFHPCKEGQCL